MTIVRLRSNARRLADAAICLLFPDGRHVCSVVWTVEGFLFPHEAVLLHQIGRYASEGRAVAEIGSMRGLSTCCLASGLRRAGRPARLIAIDPHLYASEPEFRHNLRLTGMEPWVDVRVARAEEVAPTVSEALSAVFVDGAHDLESVTRDFDTWVPKLRPGGFVLVHDSTPLSRFPGPEHLAATRIRVGDAFDAVGRVGSITWGRTPGGSGWLPRLHAAPLVDRLIRVVKRGRGAPEG